MDRKDTAPKEGEGKGAATDADAATVAPVEGEDRREPPAAGAEDDGTAAGADNGVDGSDANGGAAADTPATPAVDDFVQAFGDAAARLRGDTSSKDGTSPTSASSSSASSSGEGTSSSGSPSRSDGAGSGSGSGSGSTDSGGASDVAAGVNALYETVRDYRPQDLDAVQAHVSPEAVDAMKRTVMGVLGTLPTDAYSVEIRTAQRGLARLLYSSLCTGFAFRTIEFRLSLASAWASTSVTAPPVAGGEGGDSDGDDAAAAAASSGAESSSPPATASSARAAAADAASAAESTAVPPAGASSVGLPPPSVPAPAVPPVASSSPLVSGLGATEAPSPVDDLSAETPFAGEDGGSADEEPDVPDYMAKVPSRGRVDPPSVTTAGAAADTTTTAAGREAYIARLEAEVASLRAALGGTGAGGAAASGAGGAAGSPDMGGGGDSPDGSLGGGRASGSGGAAGGAPAPPPGSNGLAGGRNALLEYLTLLPPDRVAALHGAIEPVAVDAMRRVVRRLVGTLPSMAMTTSYSANRDFFASLVLWCLMVGYVLRDREKRMELEGAFRSSTRDGGVGGGSAGGKA